MKEGPWDVKFHKLWVQLCFKAPILPMGCIIIIRIFR
jgi:hypothetical protein